MPRRDDSPALASNWVVVLLADGLVGVGVAAVGGWTMARGSLPIGAALVAAAVLYLGLIVGRGMRWRRLRREAGPGS
ncbi:MAG TPA: hypothetical protein VF954_07510 [Acidimicrobiales bacterium]